MINEANVPSSACRLWRFFMVETSTPPASEPNMRLIHRWVKARENVHASCRGAIVQSPRAGNGLATDGTGRGRPEFLAMVIAASNAETPHASHSAAGFHPNNAMPIFGASAMEREFAIAQPPM